MFDAALSLLEGVAFAIRGHVKDREKALRDCQQIAAACLVLRAAAKLNRDKTIDELKAGMIPVALIDLLSALPDAPKGKE